MGEDAQLYFDCALMELEELKETYKCELDNYTCSLEQKERVILEAQLLADSLMNYLGEGRVSRKVLFEKIHCLVEGLKNGA